jgi:LSD1 subclass zinc finger protein
MRVPFAVLRGKQSLNVRCPQCQTVITLRSKPAAPPAEPAGAPARPVAPPPVAAGEKK